MAAGLQRLGVGVGDPVIVSLPRSIDSIATMLAVMKSGGVYVPVDSHQAAKRCAFVAKDTGARVMIAEDTQVERPRLPCPFAR